VRDLRVTPHALTGHDADREAFRRMMRDSMGDSPTMRNLVSGIGNDTDPNHRITAPVGTPNNVMVDSFGARANGPIDLADLRQFPQSAASDHPNEMTRGEQIAHILAERRSAMTSADPTDFNPAHAAATAVHNEDRAERGQAAETSSPGHAGPNGGMIGTTNNSDGTRQDVHFDASGNIISMDRP